MKTITKLLLAGTALAASGAASAATINGSNDLVLFVTDTDNSHQFVQDLGVTVDSLGITTASVQADANANPSNEFSTLGLGVAGSGLNNPVGPNGIDSALALFLSNNAGGHFTYGILGQVNGGNTSSGNTRVVGGYTGTLSTGNLGALFTGEPSSSNVSGYANGINSFFFSVNAGTNTAYGSATGNGAQAASTGGVPNNAALGTKIFLYELSTFDDTANPNATQTGGTTDANFYASSVGITVGTDGSITGFTTGAPVPLPAAVWLLGSGVVGLFGIGRRRRAIALA